MSSNFNLTNIKLKFKLTKPHELEVKETNTRPNSKTHGHINGIKPGTIFKDRYILSQAGLHTPLQAGIAGSDKRGGTESVVFNGNYPYGDGGDIIWYMGSGGFRCPITGKPTKTMSSDQTITGAANKSLVESSKTFNPIRVIRGSSIQNSPWAPMEGYRYDGLYKVTKQIKTIDPSNETEFTCYMWRMERILDDENDYEIPVKNGLELLALKRSKEGIARKYREDLKGSNYLNQNGLISKIVPKKRLKEDTNKNQNYPNKSSLSKTGNNLIDNKMITGSSKTITMNVKKPKENISHEQALLRRIKIPKKSHQHHPNVSINIPKHQKNSMLIQSSSTSTIPISNSYSSRSEENPIPSNLSSPSSTPHSPLIMNQIEGTTNNNRLTKDLPKLKEKDSNSLQNDNNNHVLVKEEEEEDDDADLISNKATNLFPPFYDTKNPGKSIKEENSDQNQSIQNNSKNKIQESIEEDIDELSEINSGHELQQSSKENNQALNEEEGTNWLSFIDSNEPEEEEEDMNWALLSPKRFSTTTNTENDQRFQDLMILPPSITTNHDIPNDQNNESLMDPNIYNNRIEFDFDNWKYFVDGFEIVDNDE
ncbi:hypothetical protein CROQUDRAFT_666635 [Cronartium quercuum f. sp. fusiforme G11]|uniref:YDG domain-containing protein n=1 Tax=Cronartium quercuum f. sp. fusiforme G11 TaxID=708437 RepID=A0A9P6N7Z1_9BASI|nr:hypothetical protein CROQUDRAFT_666635 [Cronartium quercuum f. sp. fusiforme G11]